MPVCRRRTSNTTRSSSSGSLKLVLRVARRTRLPLRAQKPSKGSPLPSNPASAQTKLPEITSDEWLEISRALEVHHTLFYKLWKLGKPIFTDEIDTACVEFDDIGDVVAF